MKSRNYYINNQSDQKTPFQVALIGAGKMAQVFLNQITKHFTQIHVAVIVNRNTEKALKLLKQQQVKGATVAHADDIEQNIKKGITSVTDNLHLIGKSKSIDAFVEMTGSIEFAAKAALLAINNKKHFINFNSELDSTLGPILSHKAQKAGVIYTGSDGDQPGVTLNLYNYVKSLGMTPLVCGSNKGMIDYYRTPETQTNFAKQWNMSPHMVTSFADGTKVNMEQCCIANATGMRVEKRGMRGERVDGHVDDHFSLYDMEKLKKMGGVVDFFLGASPKPGVYIYATTDDPIVKEQLAYLKMGDGPMYSFYIPYHLCALELPNTVLKVMQEQKPVFAPLGAPYVEVIAQAKTNLKAGQRLDGPGRFTVYGMCENTETVWQENLLPIGLTEGAVLKRDIAKDQPITFEDIETPDLPLALDLYKEQQKLFQQKVNKLS
jgi:predicted homoserine dehydrogenase-like protein